MDQATFKRRITVAVLCLLTGAVVWDYITGAEYAGALLGILGGL